MPCPVFQSTRPIRGATALPNMRPSAPRYFNPRAPYGARRSTTHRRTLQSRFQSTRPIRGATNRYAVHQRRHKQFQSTRPIRGATSTTRPGRSWRTDFNPRAPYGARQVINHMAAAKADFNPRAPYGARQGGFPARCKCSDFNPRAPYGARLISIETLPSTAYFNPRAPYGARLWLYLSFHPPLSRFQSTRPIRGATAKMHNLCSAFLQQQTVKA